MSLIVYGLGGNFLLTYGLGFLVLPSLEGIQKNLSQISIDYDKSSFFIEINKSLALLTADKSFTSLENKNLTSLENKKSLTFIDVYNNELETKEG